MRLVGIAAGERAAPGHADSSGHPRSLSAPQDSLNARAAPVAPGSAAAAAGSAAAAAGPGAAVDGRRPGQRDRRQQLDGVRVPLRARRRQARLRHRPGHLEGALAVAAPVLVARHASTIRPGSPDGPSGKGSARSWDGFKVRGSGTSRTGQFCRGHAAGSSVRRDLEEWVR